MPGPAQRADDRSDGARLLRREHGADPDTELLAAELVAEPAGGLDVEQVGAPSSRAARRWGTAGLLLVLLSVVPMVVLHLFPPGSRLDPMSRTLSEYALLPHGGWLFNAGVSALSVGSACVLMGLLDLRLVARKSLAAAMIALWCVGLIGLIVFPKVGFGSDPSVAGRVHWTWTLIALFALPIGAVAACRRRTAPLPRRVRRLCLFAAAWFGALTVQTVLGAVTHWHLWAVVGLIERVLSGTEIVVVGLLGLWVLAAGRLAAAQR